jgi:hypothetical protein
MRTNYSLAFPVKSIGLLFMWGSFARPHHGRRDLRRDAELYAGPLDHAGSAYVRNPIDPPLDSPHDGDQSKPPNVPTKIDPQAHQLGHRPLIALTPLRQVFMVALYTRLNTLPRDYLEYRMRKRQIVTSLQMQILNINNPKTLALG